MPVDPFSVCTVACVFVAIKLKPQGDPLHFPPPPPTQKGHHCLRSMNPRVPTFFCSRRATFKMTKLLVYLFQIYFEFLHKPIIYLNHVTWKMEPWTWAPLPLRFVQLSTHITRGLSFLGKESEKIHREK